MFGWRGSREIGSICFVGIVYVNVVIIIGFIGDGVFLEVWFREYRGFVWGFLFFVF